LTLILQFAKLANFRHAHIRVADGIGGLGIGIRESGLLDVSCGLNSLAYGLT